MSKRSTFYISAASQTHTTTRFGTEGAACYNTHSSSHGMPMSPLVVNRAVDERAFTDAKEGAAEKNAAAGTTAARASATTIPRMFEESV